MLEKEITFVMILLHKQRFHYVLHCKYMEGVGKRKVSLKGVIFIQSSKKPSIQWISNDI